MKVPFDNKMDPQDESSDYDNCEDSENMGEIKTTPLIVTNEYGVTQLCYVREDPIPVTVHKDESSLLFACSDWEDHAGRRNPRSNKDDLSHVPLNKTHKASSA